MNTKQVSITLGRTLNLGNSESFRADVGVVVDLEDGEELTEERYEEISEQVREYLESELADPMKDK